MEGRGRPPARRTPGRTEVSPCCAWKETLQGTRGNLVHREEHIRAVGLRHHVPGQVAVAHVGHHAHDLGQVVRVGGISQGDRTPHAVRVVGEDPVHQRLRDHRHTPSLRPVLLPERAAPQQLDAEVLEVPRRNGVPVEPDGVLRVVGPDHHRAGGHAPEREVRGRRDRGRLPARPRSAGAAPAGRRAGPRRPGTVPGAG